MPYLNHEGPGSHYPGLLGARPVILRAPGDPAQGADMDGAAGVPPHVEPAAHVPRGAPGDLERADGDIAVRFWRRLKEEVGRVEGKPEVPKDQDVVDIEWPDGAAPCTKGLEAPPESGPCEYLVVLTPQW